MRRFILIGIIILEAFFGQDASLFAKNLALPGDAGLASFPESAFLRKEYFTSLIKAPNKEALKFKAQILEGEFAQFKLSSLEKGENLYIIFANKKTRQDELYTQGTWIIKRSKATGEILQAKLFLRSDPGIFIRFFPDGKRSRMDILIYGGVIVHNLGIAVNFERLLQASFDEIRGWTKEQVDWRLFDPSLPLYSTNKFISGRVRSALSSMVYVPDGAFSEDGKPVLIATGQVQAGREIGVNCSGFAEWVADGLYKPLTGKYLDPEAMKKKHPEIRSTSLSEPQEEKLDPYFGLDWTRNLAQALLDAIQQGRKHGITESDVTQSPFALFADNGDTIGSSAKYTDYPAYAKNVGYESRGLKALMYTAAIKDPDKIYFVAFSKIDETKLRRYYHVAVLIPYFDDDGIFYVDSYESGAETNIDDMMARDPKRFAHIVATKSTANFSAPRVLTPATNDTDSDEEIISAPDPIE